MLNWTWGIIISIVIIVALGILYYMGYFYTPTASVKDIDDMNMNFRGHYKFYSKAINHFISLCKKYEIEAPENCTAGSFYYDKVTPDCDLNSIRWSIFIVISPDQYEKYKDLDLPELRLYKIPKSPIAITTFPMRNFFSYSLGAKRAYPVLNQLITENEFQCYGCIELYNHNEPINYIFYLEDSPVFEEVMNDLEFIDLSTL